MADLSTPEGKLVEWLRLPKKPSECGNFVEVHAGRLTEAANALDRASAAERERDELKAEVKRLREALKPFSRAHDQIAPYIGNVVDEMWTGGLTSTYCKFTMGDLRRARAALRTEESP